MSDLNCVTDRCGDALFGCSASSGLCPSLFPLIQDFPISALTGRAAFLHKPTSFGLPGLSNTLASTTLSRVTG
ncbi:unnamed protein product [Ectocarpus sp. CCAP 1310/34]|nr:unnamed protein product [Ectocarpus sp. CCAP 1310/34]